MLVATTEEFTRRYPSGYVRSGFSSPTTDGALLEAALVHIRLVDEFLGGSISADERGVYAQHWLPGWSRRLCISSDVRKEINAQVAHLSWERVPFRQWDIRGYAYACCEELASFLDAVAADNPERSKAFDGAREHVDRGLAHLRPAVSTSTTLITASVRPPYASDEQIEAEPVVVSSGPLAVTVTLDDGTAYEFDRGQLETALRGEPPREDRAE